jgi:hypothetical protein
VSPELKDLPEGINHAIQLQLVLLPPEAADISAETPPDSIVWLKPGSAVRHRRQQTKTKPGC